MEHLLTFHPFRRRKPHFPIVTSLKAKQPGGLVFLSLGQTALPFAPLTEPCVAATVAAWKKRAVDKTADHAQEDPALPACWNTAKPHSWPLLKLARTWMRPRGKNWHIAETLHYRKRGKQLWTPCTASKHFKNKYHLSNWPRSHGKLATDEERNRHGGRPEMQSLLTTSSLNGVVNRSHLAHLTPWT